jgi:hypothetical protein
MRNEKNGRERLLGLTSLKPKLSYAWFVGWERGESFNR